MRHVHVKVRLCLASAAAASAVHCNHGRHTLAYTTPEKKCRLLSCRDRCWGPEHCCSLLHCPDGSCIAAPGANSSLHCGSSDTDLPKSHMSESAMPLVLFMTGKTRSGKQVFHKCTQLELQTSSTKQVMASPGLTASRDMAMSCKLLDLCSVHALCAKIRALPCVHARHARDFEHHASDLRFLLPGGQPSPAWSLQILHWDRQRLPAPMPKDRATLSRRRTTRPCAKMPPCSCRPWRSCSSSWVSMRRCRAWEVGSCTSTPSTAESPAWAAVSRSSLASSGG